MSSNSCWVLLIFHLADAGEDGYFRGEVIFESRDEAEKYLELYTTRINSKLNVYGKIKTAQRLRVFEIDKQ